MTLRIALGGAVASGLVAGPARAESRSVCDAAVPHDPLVTATAFVAAAVERRSTAAAFRLTTSSLRKGTTCRDWAVGRLPVRAFLRIDWRRSSYRLLAAGEGQVVLRIVLVSRAKELRAFLMDIRRDASSPGWRVGDWLPVRVTAADRQAPRATGASA
jgi:hypothetical protein